MSYRVCGNCDYVINNRVYDEDSCPKCDSFQMLDPLEDTRDWNVLYRQQLRSTFLEKAQPILKELFQNNQEKIEKWLSTENLNFGGSSPNSLIDSGRGFKILHWLEQINQ